MKTTILAILAFIIAHTASAQPLSIFHLSADSYIFTTYHDYQGQPFPSNGMYTVTNDGVIMFDTPWDTTQVVPLLDSIYARHHKKVTTCIATHFHADRTAGFDIMKRMGIKTYSTALTLELCKRNSEPQAQYTFSKDTTFSAGSYTFETFYPGAGHAPDNIVIWCPQTEVLYGGCFVKSRESTVLGNLSDASIPAWKKSVKRTMKKYPNPSYIIPGHLSWGSPDALKYTFHLLTKGI